MLLDNPFDHIPRRDCHRIFRGVVRGLLADRTVLLATDEVEWMLECD